MFNAGNTLHNFQSHWIAFLVTFTISEVLFSTIRYYVVVDVCTLNDRWCVPSIRKVLNPWNQQSQVTDVTKHIEHNSRHNTAFFHAG